MKITDGSVEQTGTSKPSSSVEIDQYELIALNNISALPNDTDDEPMI